MVQVSCQAILFDMDGVLIDSTPAVSRVWHGWALEHGLDPEEVVARAHGRPSLTTVREYFPDSNAEEKNQEVERREIEDLDGVVPLPGAQQLLASLPLERWAIVTSSTRRLAEVRLRAAGLRVPKRLITASDVQHGKPHPEPFLKGASALGYSAHNCVVVEDAPSGIRAGKSAEAQVIAFRTTTQDSFLRNAGADWILNSCADIHLEEVKTKLCLVLKQ